MIRDAAAIANPAVFVRAARAETANQRVTCSVAQLEGGLDVEVHTTCGTLLDRRSFAVGRAHALQALRTLEQVTAAAWGSSEIPSVRPRSLAVPTG